MRVSSLASAPVGRVVRRMGGVALDVMDTGRRTYDFARTLYRREAPIGRFERARLVTAAGGQELMLTLLRQLRTPDYEKIATTLAEAPMLVQYLDHAGALTDPTIYHEAPRVPDLEWRSRSIAGRHFEHVTFPSPYAPGASVPGAARYAEHTRNEIAHAWMLRQQSPAPWVVCVHGAGMGDPMVDLTLFRAAALRRRGFNVAIPVLPHHGPRAAGRFQLAFPSADLVGNLHGAAQAIADVRAVLAYIAARDEPAALYGISFGAYVAAAVAALEPSLTAVIAGVPVVAMADLFRTHAARQNAEDEQFVELFERARELEAVTSPIQLGRPATTIRRIYAGRADRLVLPDQVERLVDHWGVGDATWFSGGHLGFMNAASVRRCLSEALLDAGIARRRNGHVVAAP
jgi:pimeloyl-ACP methyl ester carboxylesterase